MQDFLLGGGGAGREGGGGGGAGREMFTYSVSSRGCLGAGPPENICILHCMRWIMMQSER